MAKKSFKDGLGSLLDDIKKDKQSEQQFLEEQKPKKSDEYYLWIETKIERQNFELMKWRTGQLTVEMFAESLKEHQLKYNPDTNRFEKLAD